MRYMTVLMRAFAFMFIKCLSFFKNSPAHALRFLLILPLFFSSDSLATTAWVNNGTVVVTKNTSADFSAFAQYPNNGLITNNGIINCQKTMINNDTITTIGASDFPAEFNLKGTDGKVEGNVSFQMWDNSTFTMDQDTAFDNRTQTGVTGIFRINKGSAWVMKGACTLIGDFYNYGKAIVGKNFAILQTYDVSGNSTESHIYDFGTVVVNNKEKYDSASVLRTDDPALYGNAALAELMYNGGVDLEAIKTYEPPTNATPLPQSEHEIITPQNNIIKTFTPVVVVDTTTPNTIVTTSIGSCISEATVQTGNPILNESILRASRGRLLADPIGNPALNKSHLKISPNTEDPNIYPDAKSTPVLPAPVDNPFSVFYAPTSLPEGITAVLNTITAVNVRRDSATTASSTIEFYADKDIDVDSAIYSITGYIDNEGNCEPVDDNLTITKTGPATAIFYGNNSWYNGVFELQEGTVRVKETGAMFGGTSILRPGTKMYWEGGPKDPYNKPVFQLNNAEFHFDLVNQGGSNNIFSFYGNIVADATSKVVFEKGLIFIKGSCDQCFAPVHVYSGSKFIIRKGDNYTGTMFAGPIITVDENGNPGGDITLSVSDNVTPINLAAGSTVNLTNDQEDPNSALPSQIKVVDTTVQAGATFDIQCHNPVLENTVASGTVVFSSKTANLAMMRNTDINGGLISVTGPVLVDLHFDGNCKIGSGINTMGNSVIDTIHAETANFSIYNSRNFEFWLDMKPSTEEADNIVAKNMTFTKGSSLLIKDFKLLDEPKDKESYKFRILTLLDANATYLPIVISEEAKSKTVQGPLGTYTLYAEGGPGYITLRIPKAEEPILPNYYSELSAGVNSFFTPILTMHSYELADHITQTYISATEGRKVFNERVKCWTKTSFSNNGIRREISTKVQSTTRDVLFGIDGKSMMFKNGIGFTIAMFGGYGSSRLDYMDQKALQTRYTLGMRGSWFDSKNCFELLGSYSLFMTKARKDNGCPKLQSTAYSLGAKYEHLFTCSKKFSITPDILTEVSYVTTPKTNLSVQISDKSDKIATIINKPSTFFNISPGLNFTLKNEKASFTVFTRYHQQIVGQFGSYFSKLKVDVFKEKSHYLEIGMSAKGTLRDKLTFGASVSKLLAGKKGFRAEISLGLKM